MHVMGTGGASWGDMPEAPAHLLTKDPVKALLYVDDPMAREGWATLVGVLGVREALRFASETALLWLRPDVAAAGAVGEVLDRVAEAGFVPVGANIAHLDRGGVRALWWWQLKRATAERLLLLEAVAAPLSQVSRSAGSPSGCRYRTSRPGPKAQTVGGRVAGGGAFVLGGGRSPRR